MPPVRPTSDHIDRQILDITAGLLARRGIKDTSVQAIADESGYSKSGLLRRFPSKEVLVGAAFAQCAEVTHEVIGTVDPLPYGQERDAAAVTALGEVLFQLPGYAHLLMAVVTSSPGDGLYEHVEPMGRALYAMFQPEHELRADLARAVRITSVIGALTVVALTHERGLTAREALPLVLDSTWNALGHSGAFPRA